MDNSKPANFVNTFMTRNSYKSRAWSTIVYPPNGTRHLWKPVFCSHALSRRSAAVWDCSWVICRKWLSSTAWWHNVLSMPLVGMPVSVVFKSTVNQESWTSRSDIIDCSWLSHLRYENTYAGQQMNISRITINLSISLFSFVFLQSFGRG
jgi:hypothetical protein